MNLLDLADFHLVVTHGGFGRASRASGRPKATLSRRIMELEKSLGIRLIERGAQPLRLTEEGTTLHDRTKGPLGEIAEAEEVLSEGTDRPRGRLRISSPLLFSHVAFGPIAADFIRAYPEVRLEIVAEDRIVDPAEEGYDLVIRPNPTPDENLVGRCFLRDRMLVVAAASLARPPIPISPEGIVTIPGVVRTHGEPEIWRIAGVQQELRLRPDPVLRLSSKLMMREAVRAGVGAALLPRILVASDLAGGQLSSWGEVADQKVELWVLRAPGRLVSKKISSFINFICAAFDQGTPG